MPSRNQTKRGSGAASNARTKKAKETEASPMDNILVTEDVSDPDDPLNKMIPLKPIENYYELSKKLKHTYRISHSDSHAPYTELFGQRPECFDDAQQKLMIVLGKYHFECTTSLAADQIKYIKTDGLTTKQLIQLVTDFTLFKSDIEKYVDPPDIIVARIVIIQQTTESPSCNFCVIHPSNNQHTYM